MTKIESVVKNALLNGKDFQTKRGWMIRVTADDNVEIWPPQGEGRSTTLAHLDQAIKDFVRQADVMAPGVNETNPPKSISDGLPGKDTSGKSPKKFDPSVNKQPKPDGSFTDKSLGSDTSTDEGFATPSVNKDMTPDNEGLTDTDLGSDTSGNSTKFDNKVVNVQSDGRTGSRKIAKLKWVVERQLPGERREWYYGNDEWGEDDYSALWMEEERIAEEVAERVGGSATAFEVGGDREGSCRSKISDTFANGPDPSEIYRKLNAKKVSKELLAGILNEEEWEATQRLAQMDKMSPKRGPNMPGKGKSTYSDGNSSGNVAANEFSNDLEACSDGSPKKKPAKTAGPKLREKWLQDGGYHREIESESAEELHALVQGFSGEDVDWAKFKPAMPEEKEAEEVQQQPVQEGAGAAPVTAKKEAQFDDAGAEVFGDDETGDKLLQYHGGMNTALYEVGSNWLGGHGVPADSVERAIKELKKHKIYLQYRTDHGENRGDEGDVAELDELINYLYEVLDTGEEDHYASRKAQSADVEAIDEDAKDTINNYMGEYGKELTKDDGVAPKGKNPKKMLDKGKDKKAQAAPPPATPAPAPAAPAAPATPGGQAPAGGAPAPKAPAPKAPQGLQPGVGDAGIQALGWTAEDVQGMTDEQKKGILQIKLTKPGTQPKQQMPEKSPAPKTPAPGGPQAPGGPGTTPAPGSEPAPPAPSAPSPKAVKGAKKGKRAQAAPLPQTEEAPAAPAQEAPASPAAPVKAPNTPAAPKGPAKPAGQPAQDPGQAGGGQEQQAFQILQEVQQMQVNAATPNEVSTAKVSALLERLLTEQGITPDEASKLFGLQRGNFGALFK